MLETKVTNEEEAKKDANAISYQDRQNQIQEDIENERNDREERKKSPFNNFLQINKDTYKAEDWLMARSPVAYRLFRFLTHNMDPYNAVMVSYAVMQEQFGVSKETIRKAIKLLKDRQYIQIHKSGTANIYSVNKKIAWNSWGTNYKYGKFGANIIVSESEQESDVKAEIKYLKHKEISFKDEA